MGLSFTFAAGFRQRIHSRVRGPWDSRPYFTVLESTFPLLSPPTTRMAVFDPASTRESVSVAIESESYVTTDGQSASH
jgi:hypothetical protein